MYLVTDPQSDRPVVVLVFFLQAPDSAFVGPESRNVFQLQWIFHEIELRKALPMDTVFLIQQKIIPDAQSRADARI